MPKWKNACKTYSFNEICAFEIISFIFFILYRLWIEPDLTSRARRVLWSAQPKLQRKSDGGTICKILPKEWNKEKREWQKKKERTSSEMFMKWKEKAIKILISHRCDDKFTIPSTIEIHKAAIQFNKWFQERWNCTP